MLIIKPSSSTFLVFVSSLQIRWATKKTLWLCIESWSWFFNRDPSFMAYYNPHIHWGVFHPQPIHKTTNFFLHCSCDMRSLHMSWCFWLIWWLPLGAPTNSGSTCEASNTQEESLPEVLLLMLVVVDPQLYGQQKYCSSGWSKVLLLSCHLHHFSEHSAEDNQEQLGQRTHLCTRWAPTSYKWSYNLYKWRYKWVTGVITLLIGGITPFITDRGPPCRPPRLIWDLHWCQIRGQFFLSVDVM